MSGRLKGSVLACAMLARGDEQVLCAVSNESAEQAMMTIENAQYDLLQQIVAFDNDQFFSKQGVAWQYAIPVKRMALTYDEIG